jgi:stage V sporulation protein AC
MPRTNHLKTLIMAFVVGGIICIIGQIIHDVIRALFPYLERDAVNSYVTLIMIFLGSFLTAIGVYDDRGKFAGAGSIVPITGFANSVTSPAIEYKSEGVIYGIESKMFVVAGPIIVTGIVCSVIVGIIYLIIGG